MPSDLRVTSNGHEEDELSSASELDDTELPLEEETNGSHPIFDEINREESSDLSGLIKPGDITPPESTRSWEKKHGLLDDDDDDLSNDTSKRSRISDCEWAVDDRAIASD